MATSINRDMDQGADFSFTHTVKDEYGNPIDISMGYTAQSQMRRHYGSANHIDLNASITGTTGEIKVSLGHTSTAQIKAGTYFYDVELVYNEETTIQRLVQGMITVYPEVTKI